MTVYSNHVLLLTPLKGAPLDELCTILAAHARVDVVPDTAALRSALIGSTTTLITYSTGEIIRGSVLKGLKRTPYNFHAASPAFPGRDPHHFAIYEGANRYGATAHVLTTKVDAGPIVGVELFDVPPNCTPEELLILANASMRALFARLGPAMARGEDLPVIADAKWGPRKTSRADFLTMCEIDSFIDEQEFARRYRAFNGRSHDNLVLNIHGQRFRIEKNTLTEGSSTGALMCDFTEDGYRDLLGLAQKQGYSFATFESQPAGRHVVWRHDVDFSMHRAARLAEIEAGEGICASYFFNPHSAFYNMLEPAVMALARRIGDFGHAVGLHFDADAYPGEVWSAESLERCLVNAKQLIEAILDAPVAAFSFHNPEAHGLMAFDFDMAGMVNAYGRVFRGEYTYVSDSNGYWRFRSISDVLAEGAAKRLHVLTHPVWWTPSSMPPRARVVRAAGGRATAVMRYYDNELALHRRKNVRR